MMVMNLVDVEKYYFDMFEEIVEFDYFHNNELVL